MDCLVEAPDQKLVQLKQQYKELHGGMVAQKKVVENN